MKGRAAREGLEVLEVRWRGFFELAWNLMWECR